jgi:hypothetical protein
MDVRNDSLLCKGAYRDLANQAAAQ